MFSPESGETLGFVTPEVLHTIYEVYNVVGSRQDLAAIQVHLLLFFMADDTVEDCLVDRVFSIARVVDRLEDSFGFFT